MSTKAVSVSPEILGGTPVFAGTRAPVQTSIEAFLEGFPSVTREQLLAFLDQS
jgi:uncharacterized protein (DUF433 family)